MESADSFGLGTNELPDIPEEMPTIPMPRVNRWCLSRSQPIRSVPQPSESPLSPEPAQVGTSSETPRTDSTQNQDNR